MFYLRVNPASSRVYMDSGNLVILSLNGTPVTRSRAVDNWPIVGSTNCLFAWQAGDAYIKPNCQIVRQNEGTPNLQAVAYELPADDAGEIGSWR